MECDAEKKYLVHDLDGSFTGSDGSVHIIPQSERNWDVPGQEVRGIGDFRIPGVMQTDLEGNRIPMDIVRPHLGEKILLFHGRISFSHLCPGNVISRR